MTEQLSKLPLVSVVLPCLNEEDNVRPLYEKLIQVFAGLPQYRCELIFIDNHSSDRTAEMLRELAKQDPRVKVILNTRNFGPVRSGYHAFLQARGQAVIAMASDFQDPPDMLPDLLKLWEQGFKVVLAQKTKSEESPLFYLLRSTYYKTVGALSDVKLVENVTGFGLYDQAVLLELRRIDDPYPYMRGLVCDLGFRQAVIPFTQPTRKRGISKNNFYMLYDIAMLGITSHSKIPLRLAAGLGFVFSALSLLTALGYLTAKLLLWNSFSLGLAPAVVGMFFLASVQLFFLGILGEYIGAIHTQVLKRPHVVEEERLNFEHD